jgi:hypothetical protein
MMQQFDKDGDQKLDTQELTALMTSMRERRGAGPGWAQAGQPAGKAASNMRQRPGGDSKRKQGADATNRPGGEKPKRPATE